VLTPPTPEPLRRVHASARPGPGQHIDEIRLIDSRVCDDAAEREWLLLTLLPLLPTRSICSPRSSSISARNPAWRARPTPLFGHTGRSREQR